MAINITKPLTVNGAVNVLTALRAAGYVGKGKPDGEVTFFNNTTTTCNIHFTANGSSAPGTQSDGLPISTDSANAPSSTYTAPVGIDLATTWLYTGSSISVQVSVIGG